jgi:hypothetical protein
MIDSLGIFPNGVHGYASVGPHAVVVYLVVIALSVGVPMVANWRERK